MNRAALRPMLVAGLGGALILGVLLILPGRLMDAYDLARMHQCYKADFRAAILAGEIPWWNPYTALGRPFLADIETASLYPPSWLVIPFGVTTGILLIIWLHLALALEGVRRLGEKLDLSPPFALIAGCSFALSGALLGRIQSGQLQVFCVICLWPWVWLAALRLQDEAGARPVARVAGWLALAFLAGSPQILWCGLVALGAALVARSVSFYDLGSLVMRLTAGALLAATMTAVQLVPFIELIQQGNRPLHDISFATRFGESAEGWLSLLLPPGLWSHPNGEYNLYCGALFVIFAAAAMAAPRSQRNIRPLALAVLLSVVLALGDSTFVLPGLAEWVPGFSSLRYPSRYALAIALVVPLLACGWLDQAARESRLGRVMIKLLLVGHGLSLIAGIFVQQWLYRVPAAPANEQRLTADFRDEQLPRDGAPPRVALPAPILRANAGAQCGASTLTGFNNPALARPWTTLYLLAGVPLPQFHRAEVADDIILRMNQASRYFGLSAVFTMPSSTVRFSAPATPRAFICFSTLRVPSWQEAVRLVGAGHDFVRQALVEEAPPPVGNNPIANGRAKIAQFERNRITVDCESPEPGLLVLAEAWYPGWRAVINESEMAAVLPVNGWMRGVRIPAGASRVVVEYRPTNWWLVFGVSLAGWALAIGLWFRAQTGSIHSTRN